MFVAASLHAHSLAASRVEQALSEVASSMSSFTPRPGPQRAWLLQLQIWLLLAEIYLALDQVPAAAASIQEATTIFPLSHHIMYTVSVFFIWPSFLSRLKCCVEYYNQINHQNTKKTIVILISINSSSDYQNIDVSFYFFAFSKYGIKSLQYYRFVQSKAQFSCWLFCFRCK